MGASAPQAITVQLWLHPLQHGQKKILSEASGGEESSCAIKPVEAASGYWGMCLPFTYVTTKRLGMGDGERCMVTRPVAVGTYVQPLLHNPLDCCLLQRGNVGDRGGFRAVGWDPTSLERDGRGAERLL